MRHAPSVQSLVYWSGWKPGAYAPFSYPAPSVKRGIPQELLWTFAALARSLTSFSSWGRDVHAGFPQEVGFVPGGGMDTRFIPSREGGGGWKPPVRRAVPRPCSPLGGRVTIGIENLFLKVEDPFAFGASPGVAMLREKNGAARLASLPGQAKALVLAKRETAERIARETSQGQVPISQYKREGDTKTTWSVDPSRTQDRRRSRREAARQAAKG